jgi:hypothetical protein
MKIKSFTIILSLLSIGAFAQKKEIYLDDDSMSNEELIQISKNKFEINIKGYIYYNFKFDLDTLIVNVKVPRIKKGEISTKDLDSIKSELSTISGGKISKEDLIVINYHNGLDSCNSTGIKGKGFLKKLKKIENVSQFFMYRSPEGTEKFRKELNWIEDKYGTIEKTFLPLHCPCGSYVLIDENGNYYIQKGEYSTATIIKLLKNKETTFANDK